jgi:hypothetical protein
VDLTWTTPELAARVEDEVVGLIADWFADKKAERRGFLNEEQFDELSAVARSFRTDGAKVHGAGNTSEKEKGAGLWACALNFSTYIYDSSLRGVSET